jgi:hypothetical protein
MYNNIMEIFYYIYNYFKEFFEIIYPQLKDDFFVQDNIEETKETKE